jgi:hypothetical protein
MNGRRLSSGRMRLPTESPKVSGLYSVRQFRIPPDRQEVVMAKDTKPLEELETSAKQAVEQTMEQTRGAVDNYFSFVQKTMSSYPLGGTELGEKLRSYAEKNIAAANEYVRKLSKAKDFQEVIRVQTEFVQAQFHAFGEQTRSLGEAFAKTVTEAVKTPFQKS